MSEHGESPLWVSMSIIRNIVYGAVQRGADLEELCRESGLTPAMLEQADVLTGLERNIAVMEAAMRLTNDSLLGLHIGEMTSPVVLGMVGHLMESSPDLQTALVNLEHFTSAITKIYLYSAEIQAGEFIFYCEPIPAWNSLSPETARMSVDFFLSGLVHVIKLMTGKNLYPVRMSMRYARPADTREYVRILKTEPAFNQPHNYVVFRRSDLQIPVLGHNRTLNLLFKELLEKEIVKTRQQESFASEVRRTILQNFSSTLPQLQEVVEHLHTTPRTLQRKLKDEGSSFQQIADSVKSELATTLLQNQTLTVNEVAYRLGYAEPSVFRRAFKKWTGTSPRAFILDRS